MMKNVEVIWWVVVVVLGWHGVCAMESASYNANSSTSTRVSEGNLEVGEGKGNVRKLFPAFFVLGDSTVDVGNNNYILTIATAKNLPFGIDFPTGPTGRFCNGKLFIDFLAEAIGLPYPPPYLAPTTKGPSILTGVNFASAASGILRSTGFNFIGRIDFDTQLTWVSNKIQEIQSLIGTKASQELLSKSLFLITFSGNDYVNNYFLKYNPLKLLYPPKQYQKLLLDKLSTQLTQLYKLGAKNIMVTNLGPFGCIPSQLAVKSVHGECVAFENKISANFNVDLKLLLSRLNSQFHDSKFMYVDTSSRILEYRNNPTKYGFKIGDRACCGGGRFNGRLLCIPTIKPCPNRADYVFWDSFHATEAANVLLFNFIYQQLDGFFT